MASSPPDAQAEPGLCTVDRVPTAVVREVVPTAELAGFFDRSFGALADTISAQQVAICSPALARYYGSSDEAADLEVGFATTSAIRPAGDVVASALPGGRVARLVHVGAFDGPAASWTRLQSWIDARALTPGSARWEVYVTKPSPDLDPRDLRTELNWLVAD